MKILLATSGDICASASHTQRISICYANCDVPWMQSFVVKHVKHNVKEGEVDTAARNDVPLLEEFPNMNS